MNDVTPGWKTSEGAAAAVAALVTLISIVYGLTPSQGAEAQGELTRAVTSVFSLITFAVTAYRYIASREAVKVAASRHAAEVEKARLAQPAAPAAAPCPPRDTK